MADRVTFQFHVDDRAISPARATWYEAAQDAVNNGYAQWAGEDIRWSWSNVGGSIEKVAAHKPKKYELTAWAAVDMRRGKPGDRYVELITLIDTFGLPTKGQPPELPGWKIVKLTGEFE